MTTSTSLADELAALPKKNDYPICTSNDPICQAEFLRARLALAVRLLEEYNRDEDDEDETGDFLINRVRSALPRLKEGLQ